MPLLKGLKVRGRQFFPPDLINVGGRPHHCERAAAHIGAPARDRF